MSVESEKLPGKNLSEQENICSFGSFNTQTGQSYKGSFGEDGNMMFEPDGKAVMMETPKPVAPLPTWSEPVQVGELRIPIDTYYSNLLLPFFKKKVDTRVEICPLYRKHNNHGNYNEYFYHRDGMTRYIDAYAFEHCGKKIVPLNEIDEE